MKSGKIIIQKPKGNFGGGKKRAQISVNQIVVETYWKMGEGICVDPPLLSLRPGFAEGFSRGERGLAGVQRTKADGAFEDASIKQAQFENNRENILTD